MNNEEMKNGKKENDCKIQYQGIGFIKTRKSELAVLDMTDEMMEIAYDKGVELEKIIVDDTSGRSVDREYIDELTSWMELDGITVLVVQSVYDITRNVADLVNFIKIANRNGVTIYSMEYDAAIGINFDESC